MNAESPSDERGLPPEYRLKDEWEIAPADLARRLAERPDAVLLVDCRRDDEWAFNRLAGAIHVPLHRFAEQAEDVADEADQRGDPCVIVYCHHGVRSLRAVGVLRAAGITDAWSLAGGIDQWSKAIDRSIPVY